MDIADDTAQAREFEKLLRSKITTQPRQIGNVKFWRDEDDYICFNKPHNAWDIPSIVAALTHK